MRWTSKNKRAVLEIGLHSTGFVCMWYYDSKQNRYHYLHLMCWRPRSWFSFGKIYEPNLGEYSYEAGFLGLYCAHYGA